jgi:multisubunit Na+/H+ antiporter MnhB subunit
MRVVLIALTLVGMLFVLLVAFGNPPKTTDPLEPVAELYALQTVEEVRATNVITAINFDWRAYDTLGEATILLTAATGVKLLMRRYLQRRRETGTA